MQYLFAALAELAARFRQAGHILILCDYDGTLTPIVETPAMAHLPDNMRRILTELTGRARFTVGIISGRELADLTQRVAIGGIIYAGNHGLEITGPGLSFVHPRATRERPFLGFLYRVLAKALGSVRGVLVENKGLTLSVHYRQVEPENTAKVKAIFESSLSAAGPPGKFRTTWGKKVLEVRPEVDWHKGRAVEFLINAHARGGRRRGLLTVYIGDDRTDEDAFDFVSRHGGVSVLVGPPRQPSRADYFVESQEEVRKFLEFILEKDKQGRAAE